MSAQLTLHAEPERAPTIEDDPTFSLDLNLLPSFPEEAFDMDTYTSHSMFDFGIDSYLEENESGNYQGIPEEGMLAHQSSIPNIHIPDLSSGVSTIGDNFGEDFEEPDFHFNEEGGILDGITSENNDNDVAVCSLMLHSRSSSNEAAAGEAPTRQKKRTFTTVMDENIALVGNEFSDETGCYYDGLSYIENMIQVKRAKLSRIRERFLNLDEAALVHLESPFGDAFGPAISGGNHRNILDESLDHLPQYMATAEDSPRTPASVEFGRERGISLGLSHGSRASSVGDIFPTFSATSSTRGGGDLEDFDGVNSYMDVDLESDLDLNGDQYPGEYPDDGSMPQGSFMLEHESDNHFRQELRELYNKLLELGTCRFSELYPHHASTKHDIVSGFYRILCLATQGLVGAKMANIETGNSTSLSIQISANNFEWGSSA